MKLSRRSVMQGGAALLGASLFGREARAQSATEKPAVVLVFMGGGYNAIFSGADAFVSSGLYGVTASNVTDAGGGVVVDKSTLGSLPPSVLSKLCTVGVAHGISAHDAASLALFNGSQSYALQLADALGGTAAIRCALLGNQPPGVHRPVNGVSLTRIPDVSGALAAVGASATNAELPRRDLTAKGLRAAQAMSRPSLARHPTSLRTMGEGFSVITSALEAPPQALDWMDISAAYGLNPNETAINNFRSQMAGAELMVRAGADVIVVSHPGGNPCSDGGFDTHGDSSGTCSRAMLQDLVMPGLRPFLIRTLGMADRNVVTVLCAEFARSGSHGDHAGGLSASVFGKHVKQGTTGRPVIDAYAQYTLPAGTPGVLGFWAFLAAAAKAPAQPFGANPHALLAAT
jgi:hypothetical protein